jgi:SAM-dependent methyltransferase
VDVLQRAVKSLRNQGFAASVVKLAGPFADRWFDRKYGTETCTIMELDHFAIESPNKDHCFRYQPTRVLPLRKAFAVVRQMAPADSVLLDLGCGKGRVLLVAAEQGFRRIRGVEFAAELCQTARRNIAAFKARTGNSAEIQVIQGDVTHYKIQPEENIFFLFNPFDPVIFSKALDNVAMSLRSHPRELLMVICLPSEDYRRTTEQRPEFVLARKFRFWGFDFSVYASRA